MRLPLLLFAVFVVMVTVMTGFGAMYVFGLQDATHFEAVARGLAVVGLVMVAALAWRWLRGTKDRSDGPNGLPPGVQ